MVTSNPLVLVLPNWMCLFEHRNFSLKSDHFLSYGCNIGREQLQREIHKLCLHNVASTNEEEHTFLLVVFYCTDQSISRAGTEMPKATKPWLWTILVYFQFSFCQRKSIEIEPTLQESIQTINNSKHGMSNFTFGGSFWPQKKLLPLETSCHCPAKWVESSYQRHQSQLWTCNLD